MCPTVNLGILGSLGYVAYTNWDRPYWDRKTVLTTAAGLVALSGIEGCVMYPSVRCSFTHELFSQLPWCGVPGDRVPQAQVMD